MKTERFDVFPVFQPTDGVGAHPSAASHGAHVAVRPMAVAQRSDFIDCRLYSNVLEYRPVPCSRGRRLAGRAFKPGPTVVFPLGKIQFQRARSLPGWPTRARARDLLSDMGQRPNSRVWARRGNEEAVA